MERALIIDRFWLHLILNNLKTWEMRTSPTNIRGEIGLIEKGTGLIIGKCSLIDSLPAIPFDQYFNHIPRHRITRGDGVAHKWRYPWVLDDVEQFDEPIPYEHPRGAVIWVRLNK